MGILFDKVAPIVVLKMLIVVILVRNKVKLFTPTGKVKYFKISTIFPFYVKSLIIHVYLIQSRQFFVFWLMLTYIGQYIPSQVKPRAQADKTTLVGVAHFYAFWATFGNKCCINTLKYVTAT